VTKAVVALVVAPRVPASRMALVGPHALSWREFLVQLRDALGVESRARFVRVPSSAMAVLARLGDWRRGALLDTAAWRMLQRGNSADVAPLGDLLGHLPRDARRFVAPDDAPAQRTEAKLRWLLPIARASLAALWIVTGLVSLGIYPLASSYALLQQAGVPQALQPLALYGA